MNFFTGPEFEKPFSLEASKKEVFLMNGLNELYNHHVNNCKEYSKFSDKLFKKLKQYKLVSDYPFLPVQIFKHLDLFSVPKNDIARIMRSSGTSSQSPSKIFLDKKTSFNQSKVLNQIVTDFIGKTKLPFLIVDAKETISSSSSFSARSAGILGFSRFGSEKHFLLDKDMKLDIDLLKKLASQYKGQPVLFFGFTFMIFEYLLNTLKELKLDFDFADSILIHGGGWKKMEELSISNKSFKSLIKKNLNFDKVFNYYGMVEQTGSIFFECEYGHFHTSNFSEIIIRDPISHDVVEDSKEGLIQLCSLIPTSYPGQSILSEDRGRILGRDDCKCGRKGKYFEVLGRMEKAEIRGCSDTHQSS